MIEVLIVEDDVRLARQWSSGLERKGASVTVAQTPDEATEAIRRQSYHALVIDLSLPDSSALAVADFALFRRPEARVVFVAHDATFSDGSIFSVSRNACAMIPADTSPEDLAAIVEYHATAR